MKEEEFRKDLQKVINKHLPCVVQHDGWSCNTCFHDTFSYLGDDVAHLLWIAVLRIRGDYSDMSETEFLKPNKDFFKQLGEEL